MQKKQASHQRLLRRTVLTGLFVALAVVLKSFFKISFAAFGTSGIQISFAGIFTFLPAALFGPVWGGIASALSDLIGCITAPTGAYIPWLTLTAFLGGFLKGLLWRGLTGKVAMRTRVALALVFVIIAGTGTAFEISLRQDNAIGGGLFVSQTDLPVRGQAEDMSLSPLSATAFSLAQYNKDTFTLTALPQEENGAVLLPAKVNLSGFVSNITKLNVAALSGHLRVVIPNTYQTFNASHEDLEALQPTLTIVTTAGSAAEIFCQKNGIACETVEADAIEIQTLTVTPTQLSENGFQLQSSDTYRKYLAAYINFVTAGLILSGAIGLLFLFLNGLLSRLGKQDGAGGYLRILICILTSGMVVTTINTFILRAVMAVYSGRLFFVLWIPRACEELIVCLIQAYLISLLWGVLQTGGLRRMLEKAQK